MKPQEKLIEVGKTLATVIITAASVSWTVRGNFAEQDRRIAVLEAKQDNVERMFTQLREDIRDERAQRRGRE